MSDTIEAFVDIVYARKEDWDRKQSPRMSPKEITVLLAIVVAAGWEVKGVAPGWLRGNYRDQDGSTTGETYPINLYCPYKTMDEDGHDSYAATTWLDHAVTMVSKEPSNETAIKWLESEVCRSRPLDPVQITKDGDFLREYPPREACDDHMRDGDSLSTCVGVHAYCNSWVDRRQATKRMDAIVCRGCYLRVLFPIEIRTYGELRAFLASTWTPVVPTTMS